MFIASFPFERAEEDGSLDLEKMLSPLLVRGMAASAALGPHSPPKSQNVSFMYVRIIHTTSLN